MVQLKSFLNDFQLKRFFKYYDFCSGPKIHQFGLFRFIFDLADGKIRLVFFGPFMISRRTANSGWFFWFFYEFPGAKRRKIF